MTLEARYRRALERIARHQISGPVNEWSEAEAYGELQDIALEALEPGTMAARAKVEREAQDLDRARAKRLRKESTAGKRHFASHSGCAGALVCVLKACTQADLVEVKVIERLEVPGSPWDLPGFYRRDERFTTNVWNIYESQEAARDGRRPDWWENP